MISRFDNLDCANFEEFPVPEEVCDADLNSGDEDFIIPLYQPRRPRGLARGGSLCGSEFESFDEERSDLEEFDECTSDMQSWSSDSLEMYARDSSLDTMPDIGDLPAHSNTCGFDSDEFPDFDKTEFTDLCYKEQESNAEHCAALLTQALLC
jgi:hypothetical protein